MRSGIKAFWESTQRNFVRYFRFLDVMHVESNIVCIDKYFLYSFCIVLGFASELLGYLRNNHEIALDQVEVVLQSNVPFLLTYYSQDKFLNRVVGILPLRLLLFIVGVISNVFAVNEIVEQLCLDTIRTVVFALL